MTKDEYAVFIERSKKVLSCLSKERMAAYENFVASDFSESERSMLLVRIYTAMQSLSSMLLTPLQFLEIILRNRMYDSLVDFYTTQGSSRNPNEWYLWMPDNAGTKERINDAIRRAERDISKKRSVLSGDIICRLSWGTWINLLEEHQDTNDPLFFWGAMKEQVFPNAKTSRTKIVKKMHVMNAIRNRLAHHEPLWNPQNVHDVIGDLNKKYNDIFETIRWMSEDCYIYLTQHMPMKSLFDKCSIILERSINEQNEIIRTLRALHEINEEIDNRWLGSLWGIK